LKIADGLLLIQDMKKERKRLEDLASSNSWTFRSRGAGEMPEHTFDLKENHERVRDLTKKIRRLSRAISQANNTIELVSIDDEDYGDWL